MIKMQVLAIGLPFTEKAMLECMILSHPNLIVKSLRTLTCAPPPPRPLLPCVAFSRCLAAQLALGKPIFGGRTRKQQLEYIFKCCGSPGQGRWPEGNKAPLYRHLRPEDKEGKSLHFKPRLDKVKIIWAQQSRHLRVPRCASPHAVIFLRGD